jgi:radical SAM/Cys-rich protein
MLNVGRRCVLECTHCHLSCSPETTEAMDAETMRASLELVERLEPELVDVTGGSPELWPLLPELVESLDRDRAGDGTRPAIRVRTNLVALDHPAARGLDRRFAEHGVDLLVSMPGTAAVEVAPQRGDVFAQCLTVLRRLATLGYGQPGGPALEIAYNPPAGRPAPDERALERRFATHFSAMGVRVGRVRAIANVPVGRFGEALSRSGGRSAYVHRLADRFNPLCVSGLECRSTIEVAWDGRLYDCDFNLGAGLPVADGPSTVNEALGDPAGLVGRRIAFAPHCFACTAGAGSG